MEALQDLINDESHALAIAKNEWDDNDLPTELTTITGKNIITLNDYCLLDIFSCNSLTPMGLCSLAETCKRFKQIAERVFPKKFKIYEISDEKYIFESPSSYYVTVDDCERILRNFGSRLTEYAAREDAVMDWVAKYCGGVALEHLKIWNCGNFDRIAMRLKSILERVQKLTILGFAFVNVKSDVIVRCDSLVELDFNDLSYCAPFLSSNTFPNLRRFIVFDPVNRVSEVLLAFMSRHRLNYLKIDCVQFGWSKLVHIIDESCKELKELVILFGDGADTADFPKLKNLTKLEILEMELYDVSLGAVIRLLRELKSLKTLKWYSFYSFNSFNSFDSFDSFDFEEHNKNLTDWPMLPKLKKLVLRHEICAVDLQNIIKQLPILEELELGSECELELSEEDFLAIDKIVQGRANVLALSCSFNFNYAKRCSEKVKLMPMKSIE